MEQNETPNQAELGIIRFHGDESLPARDVVAVEEPLEIRLNGRTLVYLMRLPGDDVELAAGFLISEGLVTDRLQIDLISHCTDAEGPRTPGEGDPGNLVDIQARVPEGADRFETARVVRTGCGGADLDREVDLAGISVDSDATFSPDVIRRIPDLLLDQQQVFRSTGGTHGAGAFDSDGRLVVVREDVGRHNAVDKVIGHFVLSGVPVADKGLILSGRLSYEMVLKAARAGIPLVCSISAPTALGAEVGDRTGVTLVGFLRGASFNVYSHPERIGGH